MSTAAVVVLAGATKVAPAEPQTIDAAPRRCAVATDASYEATRALPSPPTQAIRSTGESPSRAISSPCAAASFNGCGPGDCGRERFGRAGESAAVERRILAATGGEQLQRRSIVQGVVVGGDHFGAAEISRRVVARRRGCGRRGVIRLRTQEDAVALEAADQLDSAVGDESEGAAVVVGRLA